MFIALCNQPECVIWIGPFSLVKFDQLCYNIFEIFGSVLLKCAL